MGIKPLLSNILAVNKLAKWADIVHFQKCFYHAALPSLIGAFFNKKPIHYDWDDWEIKIFHYFARQPLLIGWFLGGLERWMPVLSDTVSVSSQRLRQECLKYGVASQNIAMAPVGADLEAFHPDISGVRIRERFNIKGPMVIYLGRNYNPYSM